MAVGFGANQSAVSYLRKEYAERQALFEAQSPAGQRFLETQAYLMADALMQGFHQAKFILPDHVRNYPESESQFPILSSVREQNIGGLVSRWVQTDLSSRLRERLAELEASPETGVAIAARLVRHTLVMHLIYSRLPSGRSVNYHALEGEEIPSVPDVDESQPASALTAGTDAVFDTYDQIEEGESLGREQLLVPFVTAARRFYLPQWVAFGEQGKMLVQSPSKADAYLASMQQYVAVLHMAVFIAPYIIADETYQRKRYGMLGQLVNQGRCLAQYRTGEIIHTIRQRAMANDLNRGLRISLPYFDDQALQMKTHEFEVIPAGRIMFLPGFVVRAVREEEAKISQDTRLNASTRKYLLLELKTLELAFVATAKQSLER